MSNYLRKVAPCVACAELVSAREIAAEKCDSCGENPIVTPAGSGGHG